LTIPGGNMKELLTKVWKSQPGKYIIVSAKEGTRWREKVFTRPSEAIQWLTSLKKSTDLYWCPTKFNLPRRLKENSSKVKYLWADLDFIDPRKIKKQLRPTIAWESSPGRYQALWELDKIYEPKKVEEINRDLSYTVGADKSGWDLTQVLRVPGTYNNKYKEQPKVKLLWNKNNKYSIDNIKKHLKIK